MEGKLPPFFNRYKLQSHIAESKSHVAVAKIRELLFSTQCCLIGQPSTQVAEGIEYWAPCLHSSVLVDLTFHKVRGKLRTEMSALAQ